MKTLIIILLLPLQVLSQQHFSGALFVSYEELQQQLAKAKTPEEKTYALIRLYRNQKEIDDSVSQKRAEAYKEQLIRASNTTHNPELIALAKISIIRGIDEHDTTKIELINDCYNYATEHKILNIRLHAMIEKSFYYRLIKGNMEAAIDTLKKAMEMVKGVDSLVGIANVELAMAYNMKSDYVNALKCAYTFSECALNGNDTAEQANGFLMIEKEYKSLNVLDKAKEFGLKAVSRMSEVHQPFRLAYCLVDLANVYIETNEWNKVQECIDKTNRILDSLNVSSAARDWFVFSILYQMMMGKQKVPKTFLATFLQTNRKHLLHSASNFFVEKVFLAQSYYEIGMIDSAKIYIKSVEPLVGTNHGSMLNLAFYYLFAGTIEKYSGKLTQAAKDYQMGMALASRLKMGNTLRKLADSLETLCLLEGNITAAYKYSKISDSVKNILVQQSNSREVMLEEVAAIERNQERKKFEEERLTFRKREIQYTGVGVLLVSMMVVTIRRRQRIIRKRNVEKLLHEKELAELESKALRAQMNPHFIFNCMNSIKALIQNNESAKAMEYLMAFSKMMRNILNNSDKRTVSLYDEIETCKLYVQLEAMRLNNKLKYDFNIDPNIDLKSVTVPALIVQPFVENAIWHGIVPKEGGVVIISVRQEEDFIICEVDDDGIGRAVSQRNKEVAGVIHQSKGVHLSEARLELQKKLDDTRSGVIVIDKYENNSSTGTKVILTFNLN